MAILFNRRMLAGAGAAGWAFLTSIPESLAQATSFEGSGSTFMKPFMDKLSSAYARAKNLKFIYHGGGSGRGQSNIIDKVVEIGGTDEPLSQAKLDQNGLVQIPFVIGGVVPVVNKGNLHQTVLI